MRERKCMVSDIRIVETNGSASISELRFSSPLVDRLVGDEQRAQRETQLRCTARFIEGRKCNATRSYPEWCYA